jgi:hypothetical protein
MHSPEDLENTPFNCNRQISKQHELENSYQFDVPQYFF